MVSYIKPSSLDEHWKYSSVEHYLALKHSIAADLPTESNTIMPQSVKDLLQEFPSRLIFVNGLLSQSMSTEDILTFVNLSEDAVNLPSDDYFDFENKSGARALIKLNIPAETSGDLLLLNFVTQGRGPSHPEKVVMRLDVCIQSKASWRLFEAHIANEGCEFSSNRSMTIDVKAGATLERIKLIFNSALNSNFDRERLFLDRQASVRNILLNFSGLWSRIESLTQLDGEECSYSYSGLNLLSESAKFDLTSLIQHRRPNSKSEQLFKGILKDKCRSAFNGRVVIDQDAQKSDASQYNHNILMNEGPEADTRPQLEVHADDVKAAHGATVGQLDEQEVFYLQSRAIGRVEAVKLVSRGFALEVLDQIQSAKIKSAVSKILDLAFQKIIIGEGH